jgi:ABC-type transporter Mla MlaB component
MGVSGDQTVSFAIHGPITRDDLPGLCNRVCAALSGRAGTVVVCNVEGVEPDAVTVDALCRLQVATRRHRCRIQLRGASPELLDLVTFIGLTDVFG